MPFIKDRFLPFWHRYLAHIIVMVIVSVGIASPNEIVSILKDLSYQFMGHFDWLILLACTAFLVLALYLSFSRFGHIRLGGDEERPRYNNLSWFAMLFAAGMGTGLVFWGTAEPLLHTVQPPTRAEYPPNSFTAMQKAMSITGLHWALHPWGIYAISALCVAYFAFRRKQPMLPSAPMHEQLEQTRLPYESLINNFALLAVVFGLIASLGAGTMQMHAGLNLLIEDLPGNQTVQFTVIVGLLCTTYILSALGGIRKGIQPLSDLNMLVCLALMLFILVTGPTVYIMQTAVASIGDYLSSLPKASLQLRHYSLDTDWTHEWTLTYFLWWIAWGPFVSVFIARISRGRTIREFLLGVILIPSTFSMLWFATLGGTGIHMQLEQGIGLGEIVKSDFAMATYSMLEHLPYSSITQAMTIFLVFIFLITSADSGTYVLGMFSTRGSETPPLRHRLFWGVIIGVLLLGALLTGGGMTLMRTIAATGAIPFLFIMMWQVYNLFASLRRELPPPVPKVKQLPS